MVHEFSDFTNIYRFGLAVSQNFENYPKALVIAAMLIYLSAGSKIILNTFTRRRKNFHASHQFIYSMIKINFYG